jgi:GT2 family glycosyltransferase
MSVDISVIIVSYNASELLDRCLQSVTAEASASGLRVETIVVDNDSTDGSLEHVRSAHPDVQSIDAGRNGGMAFGNNVGMQAARGTTFLLLNSDAFLQPGSLSSMYELLAREGVGLVGPRLINEDGSLQRSARGFPTVWRLATEFFYIRKLAPGSRLLNGFYGAGFDHETSTTNVEWLMGAVMLVRRTAVEAVGMMEESYFMFGEEVDWQRRLHDAGWKIGFAADAEVIHLGGASTRKAWGSLYRTQIQSHIRYLALMHGNRTAARARTVISVALGLRVAAYRLAARASRGRSRELHERAELFAVGRDAARSFDIDAAIAARYAPKLQS